MSGQRERATFLVVNGDDFGYSPAINAAILRCWRHGVLTSTSLLPNRPASASALALARAEPALGVGLHLNLTAGTPLLPPAEVPSLVDRRGRFIPFPAQLRRIVGGQVRLDEIEREFRAQITFMLARDHPPTHVDGHLHVHAYPRVTPLVRRLLVEFGIGALRTPALAAWVPLYLATLPPGRAIPARQAIQTRLLGSIAWVRGRAGSTARSRLATVEFLLDASSFLGRRDPVRALRAALAPMRGGAVELMAHPGFSDDARRGAAEVALLTDPRLRTMLDDLGVRLVHYGQLIALHRPARNGNDGS